MSEQGEIMSDCAKGCITLDHITTCLCTNQCPDRAHAHCSGCLPRPAVVGHYCQKCADKFRDALYEIPELVIQLAQSPRMVTKKATGDTSRRPTKVDQMSQSPAWDFADEVILWAQSWAFIVAAGPGYDPIPCHPITGLPLRDLTRSISHISNRLTQALTEDYHAELYDETLTFNKRLTFATGMDRLEHRLKDRCPTCDHRSLVRDDGKSFVKCRNRNCGATWDESEYGRLALVIAS